MSVFDDDVIYDKDDCSKEEDEDNTECVDERSLCNELVFEVLGGVNAEGVLTASASAERNTIILTRRVFVEVLRDLDRFFHVIISGIVEIHFVAVGNVLSVDSVREALVARVFKDCNDSNGCYDDMESCENKAWKPK